MRLDATSPSSLSSSIRLYSVLIINVGVIGLLAYLLKVRLNGKAITMTSLDWEDCKFSWILLCWRDWLTRIRCLLPRYCACCFHPGLMSSETLISDAFDSWGSGTHVNRWNMATSWLNRGLNAEGVRKMCTMKNTIVRRSLTEQIDQIEITWIKWAGIAVEQLAEFRTAQ